MIELLSLGAGVQSSVVALMSAAGELPPLTAAIFADTKGEPRDVYQWLDWLEKQLPFPVYRASKGNLGAESGQRRVSGKTGKKYVRCAVPMWTQRNGKMSGAIRRDCTRDYKIRVIEKEARRLGQVQRGDKTVRVRQWIGISTDEADRMKPSQHLWVEHWWPLIDAGMSRQDCLAWMRERGYPEPPRSACVYCPYHSSKEWHRLQTEAPEDYADAAAFEDRIRRDFREHDEVMEAEDLFLSKPYRNTRAGIPLSEIDWGEVLKEDAARAAKGGSQLSLFGYWSNECEGMCGL